MDNHPCAFTLQSPIFCWRYLWSHRSVSWHWIHPLQIQVRVVQRCIKRAWTLIWTSCSVIFLPMPELFVAKQWMTCKEYFHWPLAAGKWGISGNGMEWTHLIYRYYIYRKLFHSPSRGVSHHRSRNVKLERQWVANHPGLANAWPFTLSFRKTKPKWIDCPCTRKKCVLCEGKVKESNIESYWIPF